MRDGGGPSRRRPRESAPTVRFRSSRRNRMLERPFATPFRWMHGQNTRHPALRRPARAAAGAIFALAFACWLLLEFCTDKRTELLRSASQAAHHWETAKRRRKAPVSRKSDLPPAPRRAPGLFSSQALGRASSGTTTGGAPFPCRPDASGFKRDTAGRRRTNQP